MLGLRLLGLFFGFCAGIAAWGLPAFADDTKRAAVFPFELIIQREMAGELLPPSASEAEKKRLMLMDDKLSELLKASGNFSRIDLSPYADDIEKASPIHACNGCELDFAKQAGADVVVTGLVRKVTSALFSVSIFVRDAQSGAVLKAGAVSIRENNDAGWLRAVRSIVRNRITKRSQ